MQRGVACKKLPSASLDQTRSAWAKIDKKNEGVDRLSEQQCQKFDVILMICARGLASVRFWRLFCTDSAVLWGRAGCPLSGVERCPLLGGSKCTISMGRAIGGTEFVRCTEVVRLSESPLHCIATPPRMRKGYSNR